MLKIEKNTELLFTKKHRTHFLSELKRCLYFEESLSENCENSCFFYIKFLQRTRLQLEIKRFYRIFWYHCKTTTLWKYWYKYIDAFGSSHLSSKNN